MVIVICALIYILARRVFFKFESGWAVVRAFDTFVMTSVGLDTRLPVYQASVFALLATSLSAFFLQFGRFHSSATGFESFRRVLGYVAGDVIALAMLETGPAERTARACDFVPNH